MPSTGDSPGFADLQSAREVYAYTYGNVGGILDWDRPAEYKLAAIQRVMSEADAALERFKDEESG